MGETEASFSSQEKMDTFEVSTAFVFPAAIQQLENQAEGLADSMCSQYQTILLSSPGESSQESNDRLFEVTIKTQELKSQFDELQSIHFQMLDYINRIPNQTDPTSFAYVREGFEKIENVMREVQTAIDFSKIADIRAAIEMQINELEAKQKAGDQTW
ncbi:DUF4047 domain-containing protein [Bacillus haimaensis]|uniref:DUF4047 domain-containing protein n=1 Tax=Bacillus haimaensis TaxID=3160967 RepID=UPI003AA82F2F